MATAPSATRSNRARYRSMPIFPPNGRQCFKRRARRLSKRTVPASGGRRTALPFTMTWRSHCVARDGKRARRAATGYNFHVTTRILALALIVAVGAGSAHARTRLDVRDGRALINGDGGGDALALAPDLLVDEQVEPTGTRAPVRARLAWRCDGDACERALAQ